MHILLHWHSSLWHSNPKTKIMTEMTTNKSKCLFSFVLGFRMWIHCRAKMFICSATSSIFVFMARNAAKTVLTSFRESNITKLFMPCFFHIFESLFIYQIIGTIFNGFSTQFNGIHFRLIRHNKSTFPLFNFFCKIICFVLFCYIL